MESITAVTAAPEMAAQARRAVGPALRPHDRLLVGNWTDPDLLAGERFDTVIAENLLGAVWMASRRSSRRRSWRDCAS
jgi:hypothetical protein